AEMTLYGGAHGWPQISGSVRPRSPGGTARSEGRDFVLIPGVRHPRLLVPTAPRAAAAALRQYGQPRSWAARLGVAAFALGLAGGLGGAPLAGRGGGGAAAGAPRIGASLETRCSPA